MSVITMFIVCSAIYVTAAAPAVGVRPNDETNTGRRWGIGFGIGFNLGQKGVGFGWGTGSDGGGGGGGPWGGAGVGGSDGFAPGVRIPPANQWSASNQGNCQCST